MTDIDPKSILFSLPTLCDGTPAVEPGTRPDNCYSLHEDDWRQIEFVPQANRAYIDSELQSLAAFKLQNRRGPGWTSVYLRREHPVPLSTVGLHLPQTLSLSESPLWLGSGPPWGGLVKGGFALSDITNWSIYGQRVANGQVVQLAVSNGASEPSRVLVSTIRELVDNFGLLLVDWYAASIVDTTSFDSILAWTARYHRS